MMDIGSSASVYEAFHAVSRVRGDADFLIAPAEATASYAAGEIRYSYCEARAVVQELLACYQANGVSEGSRVSVAFDSRLDVYLHLLALNALGASLVPLNMDGSDAEIMYVIEHSDSSLAHGTAEHSPRLAGLIASSTGLSMLDPGAKTNSPSSVHGDTAREAALLYTSGTTGKPKACMISNEYFLRMGLWYNELGALCTLHATDRLLTPLPPNHMNALVTSFMAMLVAGGAIIQLDRFHPSSWWQTLRDAKASIIHYLGVMPAILLKMPECDDDSLDGQVRFGFGAGSDPRHQELFEARFGFPLIEAWAMTETGAGGVTIAHQEPRHVGKRCIGKPVATMEYRLIGTEGQDVATGEPGELLVRTRGEDPRSGFFSGYYKDPNATDEAWAGGWFHTGDVARTGDDGSLYFVDRRKNVIRRSGENIAAVEVETALMRSDDIAACAVCAVPDEMRGDEVFAFIVSASGATDEQAARSVFEFSNAHLAYFKVPGYIAFVPELPLTASQKVSRGVVKSRAAGAFKDGDVFDFRALKKRRPA